MWIWVQTTNTWEQLRANCLQERNEPVEQQADCGRCEYCARQQQRQNVQPHFGRPWGSESPMLAGHLGGETLRRIQPDSPRRMEQTCLIPRKALAPQYGAEKQNCAGGWRAVCGVG